MAYQAKLSISLDVRDAEGNSTLPYDPEPFRWSPTILKREVVSLTGAAFTALSPPTGATAVLILPGALVSLTLKGITGDAGIPVTPASGPISAPLFLTLGATPALGILNPGSTGTVTVLWV
jgi:hypothetical protein